MKNTKINFATVTDSVLDDGIYIENVANGMVVYKFEKLFQNKLGVTGGAELSNYLYSLQRIQFYLAKT